MCFFVSPCFIEKQKVSPDSPQATHFLQKINMTSEVGNVVGDWPLEHLKDYNAICEDDEDINSLTFEEPQPEPLPQANRIDDWVPYEGKILDSDGDAYNFYYLFTRKGSFSIRRHHIYKSSKNQTEENPLGIYKREFVCHHDGAVKQLQVNEMESQRKRKTSRCNSSVKMLVSKRTIGFEDKWVVKYFNNHHNHELLDDKEVQFLPAYHNIPVIDQNRILLLSKVGCSVSLIVRVLELEKGIDVGNLPFLEKDIRNFIQSQSGIGKENDASNFSNYAKAFGDLIRAYEAFGDVVVFDTTYRINCYDMSLGIWVGVDNHGNSVFFGCVLLRDEKISSFTWALKNFLCFHKQFLQIKILPLKKLSQWNCQTQNTHFAYAYLKDFFFAGMTTIGRSESINLYIKRILDAKTSLTDFVNQVGVAVKIRNQGGGKARMHQKYHNPQIRTSFPIEEHAASILTPYAFELLLHEIELSTKYAATETDNGSYIVRHHTKVDGGHLVSWIQEKESIHCSCKEFEFSRILCRHVIRVLVLKNYFCLPSKYLPFRWRRESSLIPTSSHIVNYNGGSSVEFRSLIQCLEAESLKTRDREQVATRELEKVIQMIKGMPESQEHLIHLEHDFPNNDGCDVENPIVSKTKARPKGSRPKGGVEVAKKPRCCHFPNCGETNHVSRNCPNKKKNIEALPSQSPNKMIKGWRKSS